MKITIDTKEDSHEEIKKIINMLSSLIQVEPTNNELASNESSEHSSDLSSNLSSDQSSSAPDPKPIVGEGIFGMFSDNKEETDHAAQPETTVGNEVTGILNENKEEHVNIPEPKVVEGVKKHDGEPEIVPY